MGSREQVGVGARARHDGPALWIFIPAVVLSVWALWASHVDGMQSFVTVLALSALGPALAGICFGALKQKMGASICGVIVLTWYWIPGFPFLLVGVMRKEAAGGLVLVMYFFFLIIPLFFFAIVATVSFAERVGPRWAGAAMVLSFVPCFVYVSWVQAEAKRQASVPMSLDPQVMGKDVLAIHKCSQEFARANPKQGFPASLTQVGPDGTGCLSREVVAGERKRFIVRYDAGSRGTDGAVRSYTVRAWETAPTGVHNSTVYSTESGLIWYESHWRNNPRAPMIYDLTASKFETVVGCLWDGRSSWRFYENGDEKIVTDRDAHIKRCLSDASFQGDRKFTLEGYEYEYRFVMRPDASVGGLELRARPRTYGVTGLRSYLGIATFDGEGNRHALSVYATPEDRPANEQDSLAAAQEVGLWDRLVVAKEEICGEELCH